MTHLMRILRTEIVTQDRAYTAGSWLMAAVTFLFCVLGFRRLGALASTEGEFYLGLGLILLVAISLVICGLLLSVLQQLHRRART